MKRVEPDEIRVTIETYRGRYTATVKTRKGETYAVSDAFFEAKTLWGMTEPDEEALDVRVGAPSEVVCTSVESVSD